MSMEDVIVKQCILLKKDVQSKEDALHMLADCLNEEAYITDPSAFLKDIHKREEDGQDDRLFATMSNAEGQSYVPVFTNLTSFAKWYGNETFGLPFRKAKGTILQWPLSEIYQPSTGENELDKVQGIVINPFDEQPELVDWSYFEGDSE